MHFDTFAAMKKLTLIGWVCLLFTMGCIPSNSFEKTVSFPQHVWKQSNKPHFDFQITDTTASYKLFMFLKHTDAYPFSNLWVNIHTHVPDGVQPSTKRLELTLANEEGKWFATGMNEIREHKIPLNGNGVVRFNKKGLYRIELEQIMRLDPLPEVMNAGIILEKQIN